MPPEKIKVEGLIETRREIRRLQDRDLAKQLRLANRAAADIVKDEAKDEAPARSGALVKSITSQAGQSEAYVKAGSPTRVPYAGVIHFGWPRRNIKPNRFLFRSFGRKRAAVNDKYETLLAEVLQVLDSRR